MYTYNMFIDLGKNIASQGMSIACRWQRHKRWRVRVRDCVECVLAMACMKTFPMMQNSCFFCWGRGSDVQLSGLMVGRLRDRVAQNGHGRRTLPVLPLLCFGGGGLQKAVTVNPHRPFFKCIF